MSEWTVAGRITFRAKKPGSRAAIEQDAEKIALYLCNHGKEKFSDFIFDCPAISIMQPLSERVKK